MTQEIGNLIDTAWQAVEARAAVNGGRRVRRPATEPLASPRVESRFADDFPVLRELDAALGLSQAHALAPLATGLSGLRGQLRWSQNPGYDESTVGRALLDGYAYAGLCGPDCPIRCQVPRAGFMLMAPGVTYQDHRHQAREIYLVMTPGSRWRLDRGRWFDVAPGDLVYHDSRQYHATRTAAAPFLAFVAWLDAGERGRIEI